MTIHQVVLLLHLLGAGVVFSVVLFSLTLSIFKPLSTEKIKLISYLRPFGTFAVGVQLITGFILAYPEWNERSESPLFWTKMGLIVVDGVLANLIIKRKLELLEVQDKDAVLKTDLWLWTLISTLVILTVIVIGFISTNSK